MLSVSARFERLRCLEDATWLKRGSAAVSFSCRFLNYDEEEAIQEIKRSFAKSGEQVWGLFRVSSWIGELSSYFSRASKVPAVAC